MKKHFGFNHTKQKSGKIKIYADENIESELVNNLKENFGINIVSAEELGFKGRDDEFQFRKAYTLNRFLLTADFDFMNHNKFPFNQMCGLILIEVPKSYPGIDFIQVLLTDEIIPSGKELNGTKIIIKKDSITIYFVDPSGIISNKRFAFSWR